MSPLLLIHQILIEHLLLLDTVLRAGDAAGDKVEPCSRFHDVTDLCEKQVIKDPNTWTRPFLFRLEHEVGAGSLADFR